ncbi:MAG: tRNA uridine-5-carboxymethylaminomethyl(34) synthesis GTPase MnmE [Acidobacteria bacterium]|nr:tRNA uridine-5-carboxymethylaminomethyl(34) synthesis GTPase MnmE [Acidobacteriota bacterium]
MFQGDTIAAISTPPGRGGIGIIRLSGAASLTITAKIFRATGKIGKANHAQFGRIVEPGDKQTLDEALLTYFKAPHSYTGEDVVELSCHGSPVVLRKVLELVTAHGARIAEPGEFTFRAFLNRRLDLAQAQAVRDLINAQTAYQAHLATRQLAGAFSQRLAPLKADLITIIVHLESAVEFVEDDISPENLGRIFEKVTSIIAALQHFAAGFAFGRFVKEGFDLALVGRPNVGKSSVFNQLVGSDRAIVTAIPGTTRDALYESAAIAGVPVRLIDTAGIRETDDVVESLGITRTRAAIADADIVLLILDHSQALSADDQRLLDEVPVERRIVALNKSDLAHELAQSHEPDLEDAVRISALTGAGFDELRERIFRDLSGDAATERDDILITDARQQQAVGAALNALNQARDLLLVGELEEIILLKLHAALTVLGDITGETLTDDILGQIFSTFCIGK